MKTFDKPSFIPNASLWLGQPAVFSMSTKCFVGLNLVITHMCTTNTLQDCFSGLEFVVYELLVNTCPAAIARCYTCPSHHLIFRFTVERKRAEGSGPIKLKGFVFLNHSQSVIQPVHPAVSLLPQPLSSSPAIWDPPSCSLSLPLLLSTAACAKGKMLH